MIEHLKITVSRTSFAKPLQKLLERLLPKIVFSAKRLQMLTAIFS